jgi:methylated-DNA-[protein]-cysteine S-methyltransferase
MAFDMQKRMIKIDSAYMYEFAEPIGKIGLEESGGSICGLILKCDEARLQEPRFYIATPYTVKIEETQIIKEAAAQIADFLKGRRGAFDLPLLFDSGHPAFTNAVLRMLLAIPAGQTRSYGEIAGMCGNPKASRAVGMVNNKNPIPIFIPCHRVIGANGSLTGYAGGLPMKKYLLDIEKEYYA